MTRATLTETKIKQPKPRNKPYKVSDGTIGGLHVAVSTAGGQVFYLAYQFETKWRLLRLTKVSINVSNFRHVLAFCMNIPCCYMIKMPPALPIWMLKGPSWLDHDGP